MSDRILVTGGAGFIGSHLVDRLVAEGATVTVLDNFSTGNRENLAAHVGNPRTRLVDGSVLDAQLVEQLVAESTMVYHLAAAVGVHHIVADPLASMLTNVRGTENVLAAAHRSDVRVLLASTSEIYGRSAQVPFAEDGERVLGPTWVHRWSYSTSKAMDEHLAFAYATKGLRMSVVRFFNCFGPRLDERGYGSVIARFAAQALRGEPLTVHGDGLQSRSFTYVSDTVAGTLLAGRSERALGRVYNIGSAHEITIRALAEQIRAALRSSSEVVLVPYESYYPPGFQDTRRRVPDMTRARAELGFVAQADFADGLARTLAWCTEHFAHGTSSAR